MDISQLFFQYKICQIDLIYFNLLTPSNDLLSHIFAVQ